MHKEEFNKVVEDYHSQIINIAYRFLNNHADAEDIAQEVFLKFYRALPAYKPTAKISTYLYKITKNLCLNHLRRKKVLHFFSLDAFRDDPDKRSLDFPDKKEASAEKLLQEEELRDKIYGALKKLPARERVAIILKRYEDLSLEEISEVMGCSAGAVKSLLHRAKIILKKELSPYAG